MPPRNHQLGQLDARAEDDSRDTQQPFVPAVSDGEGDPVQKKYSGMFDLVRNKRSRPCARGDQRENDNRHQREPRYRATNILPQHVTISRYPLANLSAHNWHGKQVARTSKDDGSVTQRLYPPSRSGPDLARTA